MFSKVVCDFVTEYGGKTVVCLGYWEDATEDKDFSAWDNEGVDFYKRS